MRQALLWTLKFIYIIRHKKILWFALNMIVSSCLVNGYKHIDVSVDMIAYNSPYSYSLTRRDILHLRLYTYGQAI
jgi:hypothetical protein